MNVKMTNQQIKEKYGIEPIMKEMWVWDDGGDAELAFVLYKRNNSVKYPYVAFLHCSGDITYGNASETNPNDKQPKVGDKGFFWDDEEVYLYATLINIEKSIQKYDTDGYGIFKHFSHEKQPWMK